MVPSPPLASKVNMTSAGSFWGSTSFSPWPATVTVRVAGTPTSVPSSCMPDPSTACTNWLASPMLPASLEKTATR